MRLGRDGLQDNVDEFNSRLGRQGRQNRLIEAKVACDVARVHLRGRHGGDRIRLRSRHSSFPQLRVEEKKAVLMKD